MYSLSRCAFISCGNKWKTLSYFFGLSAGFGTRRELHLHLSCLLSANKTIAKQPIGIGRQLA
jgi:hypothetical protein